MAAGPLCERGAFSLTFFTSMVHGSTASPGHLPAQAAGEAVAVAREEEEDAPLVPAAVSAGLGLIVEEDIAEWEQEMLKVHQFRYRSAPP